MKCKQETTHSPHWASDKRCKIFHFGRNLRRIPLTFPFILWMNKKPHLQTSKSPIQSNIKNLILSSSKLLSASFILHDSSTFLYPFNSASTSTSCFRGVVPSGRCSDAGSSLSGCFCELSGHLFQFSPSVTLCSLRQAQFSQIQPTHPLLFGPLTLGGYHLR